MEENKTKLKSLMQYVVLLFLAIQPIFDLKMFYNSKSTLIRTTVITVIFCIYFAYACFYEKKLKKVNRKKILLFLGYIGCYGLYFIGHELNAIIFKSYVPNNFNYSLLKECMYFWKMTTPLFLIYILIASEIESKRVLNVVKIIVSLMSLVIIITNLMGISYASYSEHEIRANFLSWFGDVGNYTYMDLASKGLFEYANQISAVLLMFLPYIIYENVKQFKQNKINNVINPIILILEMLALYILGTRVAVVGTVLVIGFTMSVIFFFYYKQKKGILQNKKIYFIVLLTILYIIILPKNPMFNRINEMNNQNDVQAVQVSNNVEPNKENIIENNDENGNSNDNILLNNQEEMGELDSEKILNTKLEYIRANYKAKKIHEKFIIESYPYQYDPDFWLEIFEKDVYNRTNYRYLEKQMINRVIQVNDKKTDYLFGITQTRLQNIFNIEQDFVEQYYALGIIGVIMVFLPYFVVLGSYICKVFKSRFKYCTIENVLSCITIFMIFGIAYFSGNLLNSLSFTLYFAVPFFLLFNLPSKKPDNIFIVVKNVFLGLKKYKFLLNQLISRDFKVKYKRSILGVIWSLLYPILTMTVMALVFSNIFKFSTPGVNYLVYLLTGLVMFNYFSEATNLAMSSVVANFGLINKIYIPKYIFPLSKCLFTGINFLLTLIPLYAIILITGTPLNIYHFLIPYAFLCLFVFTLGMGLLLSAVSVFLRDMFYIYGIIMTLWMYITPIMYDIKMIDENMQGYFRLNPLYHYIEFVRTIVLFNKIPEPSAWGICAATSIVTLIIGIIVFKKNQDKFIYYI